MIASHKQAFCSLNIVGSIPPQVQTKMSLTRNLPTMMTQKSLDKRFKRPAGLGDRPTDHQLAVTLGIDEDDNKELNESIKITLGQHGLLDSKLYSKYRHEMDPAFLTRQSRAITLLETIWEKTLTSIQTSDKLRKEGNKRRKDDDKLKKDDNKLGKDEVMYVLREKALSRSYNYNRSKSGPRKRATGVEVSDAPEENLLMRPLAESKGKDKDDQMPKPQAKHTAKPGDGEPPKYRLSIRPSSGPVAVSDQLEDQSKRQNVRTAKSSRKDGLSVTKAKPAKRDGGNAVDAAPRPATDGPHDHPFKTPGRTRLPITKGSFKREEKAPPTPTFDQALIAVEVDEVNVTVLFRPRDITNASRTANFTVEHLSFDRFWGEVERQAEINRLGLTLECFWPDGNAQRWVDVTDETRWRAVVANCHEEGHKRWLFRVTRK